MPVNDFDIIFDKNRMDIMQHKQDKEYRTCYCNPRYDHSNYQKNCIRSVFIMLCILIFVFALTGGLLFYFGNNELPLTQINATVLDATYVYKTVVKLQCDRYGYCSYITFYYYCTKYIVSFDSSLDVNFYNTLKLTYGDDNDKLY